MTEYMGYEADKRIRRKYGNKPEMARIGNQTCSFRSQLELKWAKYLQWLLEAGEIRKWEFEPKTFYFEEVHRGAIGWLPDFRVVEKDGTVVWQECKGHHDGPMNIRFKRMAEQYPNEIMELISGKFEKRNFARRDTAKRYVRRVIDASKIFLQMKGLI